MRTKIKQCLRNELTGWKPLEVAWLLIASAIILILSLYWQDHPLGILSALTGVWCVILTGKGKRSSFLFGTVNVLLYAYIAFGARYFGEVMLNLLYYFPMNFVGWFLWTKYMNAETGEVIKASLPLKKSIILYACTAAAIFFYGLFLKFLNGNLPFVDSMSTVVSVVAQILSVQRLTEQWVLWIVVDIATVIMWSINFAKGGESIATLLMWSVYLLNAIFMYVRWSREVKQNGVSV